MKIKARAYTLAELMTVLAVIFVLIAVITVSTSSFVKRTAGKTTAKNVESTLKLAREYAISRGQKYYVFFDGVNGEYYIASDFSGSTNVGKINKFQGNMSIITNNFIRGASGSAACFNKNGSLDQISDSSITLGVAGDPSTYVTISVENTTGRVKIE
ncbi:MAG: GspH/FimT family pseudopilin [Candidatus Omnitrophica bacterium]|nr:GspH/FimT family pseudopilin [Candidatus Omnitrophota bacterium]